MARKFDQICEKRDREGTFVFLSAEASISATVLNDEIARRYADLKREAEDFLISECPALHTSIIRPGLVYHQSERPWSLPLGFLSNLTHTLSGGRGGPPGTSLKVLADITIREAL